MPLEELEQSPASAPVPCDESGSTGGDIAVVTVATRSYLHYARALHAAVQRLIPDARRITCCVDAIDGRLDEALEPFEIVNAVDLSDARFPQYVLALNPTAVCCALKPRIVLHALKDPKVRRVIYLDCDVALFQRPEELLLALQGSSIVLTPHHLAPLPEGSRPNEEKLISFGTYNAGIFGVSRGAEAMGFLNWWAEWMLQPSRLVNQQGYDQCWLNYVPVYCPSFAILRHPGYNVAFWNLPERGLRLVDGTFFCGEVPLVAFHFSHFDEKDPKSLVPVDIPIKMERNEATEALGMKIDQLLDSQGRSECKKWGYGFGQWNDGSPVTMSQRAIFQASWDSVDPDLDPWGGQFSTSAPELWFKLRPSMRPRAGFMERLFKQMRSLPDLSLRKVTNRIKSTLKACSQP